MTGHVPRPKLAVWKFASCDGCQLTLLDCQDELLALAEQVEIAHFPEASRADVEGPYDVSLVEGSVTTPEDAERIQRVRAQSRALITIGACATAGGVQALRNFADVAEFRAAVYARPEYVATLATSTPIADHVPVDFELRGCPIDKRQLIEVIAALLAGRRPNVRGHSVCVECKRAGHVGVVTQLLARVPVDPGRTTALVCGPEIMMRLTARELLALGVAAARVRISLERNMRCGVAECGHCQLGPLLLCRDGPVVSYEVAAPLLAIREL